MTKTSGGYIVRSEINPKIILCTDGEFHPDSQVGPGGWCAKIYKTEAGARKANPNRTVEALGVTRTA